MLTSRRTAVLACVVLGALAGARPADGSACLPRAALAEALRAEQGYERRATTNQSRLQTRVLLRLAAARPGVFCIDHEDWFQAYLEALDLRPEQAPLSVRLSREHQYDIRVDARPGAVVERVRAGPTVTRALNVLWTSRRGTPRYSYRDPQARPVLEMTFERSVSYRLLDLQGLVVLEQIEGISGRPATGPLSVLFRLIGKAYAEWSRSAVAHDGWQVVVGRGRKGFIAKSATVTIAPDGRAEPDVPRERPDLKALEQRLRQPLAIDYKPWTRQ
jgi:hypothetical protein